jgi:hypothetical protein
LGRFSASLPWSGNQFHPNIDHELSESDFHLAPVYYLAPVEDAVVVARHPGLQNKRML